MGRYENRNQGRRRQKLPQPAALIHRAALTGHGAHDYPLVHGCARLTVFKDKDHPFNLPPPAKMGDVPDVTALIRTAGRFPPCINAILCNKLGCSFSTVACHQEGHLHHQNRLQEQGNLSIQYPCQLLPKRARASHNGEIAVDQVLWRHICAV